MRKLAVLYAVCLMLVFSGCQDNTLDRQGPAGDRDAIAGMGQAASTETAPPAAGQDTNQLSNDDIVEIRERMFIAQLNDIYFNHNDYLGKTIKYEGMFTASTWEEMGQTYYHVYRQSPGCCGADGQAGFEVVWPDGSNESFPNENDWCEVVGTLDNYDEDGYIYLHIILDSLTVKNERGAEFVSQ